MLIGYLAFVWRIGLWKKASPRLENCLALVFSAFLRYPLFNSILEVRKACYEMMPKKARVAHRN